MASAAMNVAAHSIHPPYAIPAGPRVRPPRLLPGTKADNTNAQPEGPIPENAVWVQGKWRNPSSNAAKDRQLLKSKQAEKALRHHTHGMSIYAYRHFFTNQVVYSLTRIMQNDKILPQLVYHRKKTVPAALRRDAWRPYFSIQFQRTPAGAQAGLLAYQQLRELALKRQLDPPREMLIATQEDVEKERKRINPTDLRDRLMRHQIKDWPRLNQLLPARYRARKLMDHRATSVADTSFVLNLINKQQSPAQRLAEIEENRVRRHKARTPGDRRRVNEIAEREKHVAGEIKSRQQGLNSQAGQLGLDRYAAQRIAMEYGGALTGEVSGGNYVGHLQDIEFAREATSKSKIPSIKAAIREAAPAPFRVEEARRQITEEWNEGYLDVMEKRDFTAEEMEEEISRRRAAHAQAMKEYEVQKIDIAESVRTDKEQQDLSSRLVQVLWADKRDGTYAASWPDNVYHGWLDPKAVLKEEVSRVREPAHTDADGLEVSEQKQKVLVQHSTSSHVFGRDTDEGWYESPAEQQAKVEEQGVSGSEDRSMKAKGEIISLMFDRKSRARLAKRYPVYASELNAIDDLEEAVERTEDLRAEIARLNDDYVQQQDQLSDLREEQRKLEQARDQPFESQVWKKATSGQSDEAGNQEKLITITQEIEGKLLDLQSKITEQEQLLRDLENEIEDRKSEQPEVDEETAILTEQFPALQTPLQQLWQTKRALQQSEAEDNTAEKESLVTDFEEATRAVEEGRIREVLEKHRIQLSALGDENAQSAGWSPSQVTDSAASEKRGEIDTAALGEMGVAVEEQPKGVWQRVKGVFGRK